MDKDLAAGMTVSDRIEKINLEERLEYTPDWRWRQAGRAFKDRVKSTDALVKQLAAYLKVRHKQKSAGKFRPFVQLERIYRAMEPSAIRWYIEALLIAGATDDAIASFVGLPASLIQLYHDVYYDIRPYRDCKGMLLSHALRRLDCVVEYDAIWKRIGWHCGVEALQVYWSGQGSDAIRELLDRHLAACLQRAAIQASQQRLHHIDPRNEGEVIDQYAVQNATDREAGKASAFCQLPALELRLAPRTSQAVETICVPDASVLERLQGKKHDAS